jgi:hypothetical protein
LNSPLFIYLGFYLTLMGNRKVKNAIPMSYKGIEFKSKLEYKAFKAFEEAGIVVGYERLTFTLLESFSYNGEKVRRITLTPDFDGEGFIVETKGFPTDHFKLKWKMFKHHLHANGIEYDLYLPRTMKDVLECISVIKKKNKSNDC